MRLSAILFSLLSLIWILGFSVTASAFNLSSSSFAPGKNIPALYTCDGKDISPALSWQDEPDNTKSYILIMSDPDAPSGIWYHWLVFNIPRKVHGIAEGGYIKDSLTGVNSWGKPQYNGPCPPIGSSHHYIFDLYALDVMLSVPTGANLESLLRAAQGHILVKTSLKGLFSH